MSSSSTVTIGTINNPYILNSTLGGNTFIESGGVYPTTTSSLAGLGIMWNTPASGLGETTFVNYSQGGAGGFYFSRVNSTQTPTTLATLDGAGNYSVLGSTSCVNSTVTGTLYVNNITINGTINNANISNMNKLQYLDVSSSLTTQLNTINTSLAGKQATITTSTNLVGNSLTVPTISFTSSTFPSANTQLGWNSTVSFSSSTLTIGANGITTNFNLGNFYFPSSGVFMFIHNLALSPSLNSKALYTTTGFSTTNGTSTSWTPITNSLVASYNTQVNTVTPFTMNGQFVYNSTAGTNIYWNLSTLALSTSMNQTFSASGQFQVIRLG